MNITNPPNFTYNLIFLCLIQYITHIQFSYAFFSFLYAKFSTPYICSVLQYSVYSIAMKETKIVYVSSHYAQSGPFLKIQLK